MGWVNQYNGYAGVAAIAAAIALAALVCAWGIIGAWLDLTRRRLPNWWLLLGVGLLGVGLLVAAALRATEVGSGVLADGTRFVVQTGHAAYAGTVVGAMATGGLIWFGVYLFPFIFVPGAIGSGDVKLAVIMGAWVGLAAGQSGQLGQAAVTTALLTAMAIVLAAVFTLALPSLAALGGVLRGAKGVAPRRRKADLAHGPGMLLAAACVCALAGTGQLI